MLKLLLIRFSPQKLDLFSFFSARSTWCGLGRADSSLGTQETDGVTESHTVTTSDSFRFWYSRKVVVCPFVVSFSLIHCKIKEVAQTQFVKGSFQISSRPCSTGSTCFARPLEQVESTYNPSLTDRTSSWIVAICVFNLILLSSRTNKKVSNRRKKFRVSGCSRGVIQCYIEWSFVYSYFCESHQRASYSIFLLEPGLSGQSSVWKVFLIFYDFYFASVDSLLHRYDRWWILPVRCTSTTDGIFGKHARKDILVAELQDFLSGTKI